MGPDLVIRTLRRSRQYPSLRIVSQPLEGQREHGFIMGAAMSVCLLGSSVGFFGHFYPVEQYLGRVVDSVFAGRTVDFDIRSSGEHRGFRRPEGCRESRQGFQLTYSMLLRIEALRSFINT